jgi:hypothetical protein
MRSNNMTSEKATYWMAVGLLALFVGNHFVSKFNGNCLAEKARFAAERVSAKADHLTAMADVMLGRTATRFDCAQVAMAMTQVRLASMQNQLARGEAACIRLQASRARMIVLRQLPTPVVCPRERLEMVMPRLPAAPSADPI